MRRYLLLLALAAGLLTTVQAQDLLPVPSLSEGSHYSSSARAYVKPFSHLDLSVTTGSTGVGFDVSMPINKVFSLRAGYATMPHFTHTMHFGVDVGDDPATSQHKFDRLAGLLEDLTGNRVDNVVDMEGKPTYWNWKLMVDVRPFRNKHWHFTAGVYAGNRQVAKAVNAIEDMPSLMAVDIYNNLQAKAVNGEPLFVIGESGVNVPPEVTDKLLEYGRMSIYMGEYKHDVLYPEDVVVGEGGVFIGDDYYEEGTILHKANDPNDPMIHEGDPYRVVPDENSMVKAWAFANRLKPYLGFGYGGRLLKKDPRWQVSFDCGAMFWGGTPQIITHDGTDLVNDVKNVRGRVGDYVDLIKKFKVFPVLNLRITRRLF